MRQTLRPCATATQLLLQSWPIGIVRAVCRVDGRGYAIPPRRRLLDAAVVVTVVVVVIAVAVAVVVVVVVRVAAAVGAAQPSR